MTKDYIAFRLDDVTPDMDWNNFYRLKNLFYKYNIKPLMGIVPDNRDKKLSVDEPKSDFYEQIKALMADGWCVAMHGCCHVYDSKDGGILRGRALSEFAGHSFEEQLEKLSYGKQLLEKHGIAPEVFMAPGHTFDKNTVEALNQLGFKYITDGLTDEPYIRYGIVFLPSKNARPKVRSGFDTICLHANGMNDEDFEELETFLINHGNQVVPFSEMLLKSYKIWGIRHYIQEKKNRTLRCIRGMVARNKILHGILALRK